MNDNGIRRRVQIEVMRRATEPRAGGTYPLIKTSEEVDIEIDVDAIAELLGQKASKTQRGFSLGLGGLVKVCLVRESAAARRSA